MKNIIPKDPRHQPERPPVKFVWWHAVVVLFGVGLLNLSYFTFKNPILDNPNYNSMLSGVEALFAILLIGFPWLLQSNIADIETPIIRLEKSDSPKSSYTQDFINWGNSIGFEMAVGTLIIIFVLYITYFY